MMPARLEIPLGTRFGRWTVLEEAKPAIVPASGWPARRMLCQCDCGSPPSAVRLKHLRNGRSQSCGCLKLERNTTHGMAGTPTYRAWQQMWQRCTNPNCQVFKHYGARGITVDPRWRSFEAFLNDMGVCPPGMTLERINNDGLYNRENTAWANRQQQALNRRARSRWGTGVQPIAEGKWLARIWIEGENRQLGIFDNQRQAQAAHDHTARELYRRAAVLQAPHLSKLSTYEGQPAAAPVQGVFPSKVRLS